MSHCQRRGLSRTAGVNQQGSEVLPVQVLLHSLAHRTGCKNSICKATTRYQESECCQTEVGKAIVQVSRKAPENGTLNGWCTQITTNPTVSTELTDAGANSRNVYWISQVLLYSFRSIPRAGSNGSVKGNPKTFRCQLTQQLESSNSSSSSTPNSFLHHFYKLTKSCPLMTVTCFIKVLFSGQTCKPLKLTVVPSPV